MRTNLVRILGGVFAFALLVAACGGSDSGSSGGYTPPKGPVVQSLDIHAGNFYFKPDAITANAGVTKLTLTDDDGIHTLQFDNGYSGFHLEVSGSGDSQSQKLDLKPGKYTFFCNIAGHRAQGMEGTITVK